MAETLQRCTQQPGKQFTCVVRGNRKVAEFINGKPIKCFESFRAPKNIAVGNCYIGDENLAALMVKEGWLIADRDFSHMYLPEEYYARLMSRGLWKYYQKHPLDYVEDNKKLVRKVLEDPNLQKLLKDINAGSSKVN